jgi:presenilin-like A22 family membrane protease
MRLSLKYFFNFPFFLELFVFAFSLYLAIGTALSFLQKIPQDDLLAASATANDYSVFDFILMFAIATILLLLILKYYNKAWIIKGLFYLAIIEGLIVFGMAFFEWPHYLYIAAFFLLSLFLYQNVLVHNMVIVLVISAIASIFGLNFEPNSVVVILVLLAVYDYWAVYRTKHMVSMFKSIAEKKVHFSIIIPQNFKGLFKKLRKVNHTTEFMFLGTGDIALPAILVVSSLRIGVRTSLITALGAIVGFLILYTLFITQENRKPMPGLPAIVFGTVVGYLLSFII